MTSLIAYTILAGIVISGAIFLRHELNQASDDLADSIAHGDVIEVPTVSHLGTHNSRHNP